VPRLKTLKDNCMQVILRKDIPELGRMGEIVKVKDGYARNYLIPKALVMAADPGNVIRLEHQKRLVDVHKKKVQKESEEVSAKLSKVQIKIQRRFNESGKMFGSLNTVDLAAELATKGYKVDRRDIEVEEVRGAGETKMRVRLPGDVWTDVSLHIEALPEKGAAKAEVKKIAKGSKSSKAKKAKAADSAEEGSVQAEADGEATREASTEATTEADKE
jgi:large subunit ribosomal protein L9